MIRVVYSNRTEELVAELGARVRAQQAREGALSPVPIVVPGRSLETHVRLGIAREQGIAANLDVSLLTRFAARVAAPAVPVGEPPVRVADAASLEAMVLQLLLDDAALAAPALGPVVSYLRGAGSGVSEGAADLRRVQLAAREGRLFEEYTYSRGEMLEAWSQGVALEISPSHAEVERGQRALWVALFGVEGAGRSSGGARDGARDGIARRASPRLVPLHEAVAALAPAPGSLPAAIHVFGFAHVARTFHQLLARLGRATEVVVYTLSPCEGFWEDVDPRDPALLSLWARPGRENVRALNALSGFDHEDRFAPPAATTPRGSLLHALQDDLLHRRGSPAPVEAAGASGPPGAGAADVSLQVHEHASVRRECEAVASAIWQAVREDPSLPFDAIVVLVPQGEASAYAAHLGAAFREAHAIPFQALGLPDPTPSRVALAIELLLALPLGQFTRPELLEVLTHPCVVAAARDADPEASPAQWLAWCEALGIVHGADHADHASTYIARDILNWDQGLRRLSLGAFMTGEASGESAPFVAGPEAYLPVEVAGTELHDAATFGLLVRSLLSDARYLRSAELPVRAWAEVLGAMVETYVAPTSDAEVDELSRRLRQLGSLGDVELGGCPVSYRIACELARARLAGGSAAHGSEGVVLSTIAAARGIPARVVFACGLGEGRFPSADADDPLDLRWAARREGDVTARERDKYAFLEVLLGARERLVLSYVSRDPLTGDPLAASSVVQELLLTLSTAYGRPEATLRTRHPLRRWDPAYFPGLGGAGLSGAEPAAEGAADPAGPASRLAMELPEARAEAVTLAVRRGAERAGAQPSLGDVVSRAEGGDPAWLRLAAHLGVAPLPPRPVASPSADPRVTVPMHALAKFLELPLQGWARFRLGLDEGEEEDLAAREAEPFETAPRDETLLLRDVLLDAAERGLSMEEAYDAVARARELRGTGPSGVFARGERGDHLRVLEEWRTHLAQGGIAPRDLAIHRFGRGGEHTRAHAVHESLLLDVGVEDASKRLSILRVEVGGRTLPVASGDGDGGSSGVSGSGGSGGAVGRAHTPTTVVLAKRANEPTDEWARAGRRRSFLRALVDYAVLTASGVGPGRGHAALLVVATHDRPVAERVEFGPMSADAAKGWLRAVVAELLGAPHDYFLPCEAVFVRHARDPDAPLVPVLEEARDKLGTGDGPPKLRSAYGPVPRPQSYRVPDEASARAMVERRYAPLLAALSKEAR